MAHERERRVSSNNWIKTRIFFGSLIWLLMTTTAVATQSANRWFFFQQPRSHNERPQRGVKCYRSAIMRGFQWKITHHHIIWLNTRKGLRNSSRSSSCVRQLSIKKKYFKSHTHTRDVTSHTWICDLYFKYKFYNGVKYYSQIDIESECCCCLLSSRENSSRFRVYI